MSLKQAFRTRRPREYLLNFPRRTFSSSSNQFQTLPLLCASVLPSTALSVAGRRWYSGRGVGVHVGVGVFIIGLESQSAVEHEGHGRGEFRIGN